MKKYAVKLEVHNTRNSDIRTEWFFCDSESEKKAWIKEKKEEEHKWNYKTAGAVSIRTYLFDEFHVSELMEQPLSNFKDMTLEDFLLIIKNLL